MAPQALAIASVAVAIITYLQALDFPFVSDDSYYVAENYRLAALHWNELWRLFAQPYNPYDFLPLRDMSYWLDITLFGLNPMAFRLHNILLYALCCLLVYAATRSWWRCFRPAEEASAPWVAAIVTALFAIHPAHVEAAVWISSRKDVLAGMFAMLALWLAANVKRERMFSTAYATATLLALLAAMLSKATAVAVAPIITILWILLWRDIPSTFRHRALMLWPTAPLLLAAGVAPMFMANATLRLPAYFGIEAIPRSLAVLGSLTRLAISPESRHFIYPVIDDSWRWGLVALGVAVLVGAFAGVWMLLRRRSIEGFALIAFALLCMPYTQLAPYFTNSLVTDRFLFLALWPVALLIVALVWRLSPVPRAIILLVITLPWVFQSIERPRDWSSYEALIDHDFNAYPGHYPLAYQRIVRFQLPNRQFSAARATASNIDVPEARDIMIKLVDAASAMQVAAASGDPREAIYRLRALEPLFRKPPVQAQWDPPMLHFWKESRGSFVLEWRWLENNFSDDASVRYNAELSLRSIRESAAY